MRLPMAAALMAAALMAAALMAAARWRRLDGGGSDGGGSDGGGSMAAAMPMAAAPMAAALMDGGDDASTFGGSTEDGEGSEEGFPTSDAGKSNLKSLVDPFTGEPITETPPSSADTDTGFGGAVKEFPGASDIFKKPADTDTGAVQQFPGADDIFKKPEGQFGDIGGVIDKPKIPIDDIIGPGGGVKDEGGVVDKPKIPIDDIIGPGGGVKESR